MSVWRILCLSALVGGIWLSLDGLWFLAFGFEMFLKDAWHVATGVFIALIATRDA